MAFGFGKPGAGRPIGEKPALPDDKAGDWALAANALGRLNNWPNTQLGLVLGLGGHTVGYAQHALGLAPKAPRIGVGKNAIEFMNNPAAPLGAVTLGNTTIYDDDPYDPTNRSWDVIERREGHSVQEHETQHTYQGEQLGPLYLPSNLLGGATALLRDRNERGKPDWHGVSNWNERGPKSHPARPWPPRRPR